MDRYISRFAVCLVLMLSGLSLVAMTMAAERPSPGQPSRPDPDRLTIHEWGTFTCLNDEAGRAVAGVNTDDEPVPEFVHRISELIPQPSELAPVYYKGVPRSHRQVRMRLETPVLYFYPPAGQVEPLKATVNVGFRGGWLTEYYPDAAVNAPGLNREDRFRYSQLTPETYGTLTWTDLTIGGQGSLPETDAPVWLAPRRVAAANVRTPAGESEKYLFYRGVGNLRSPLIVTRDEAGQGVLIREDLDPALDLPTPLAVRALWLVHVRDDGRVAFTTLAPTAITGERHHVVGKVAVNFDNQGRAAQSPQAAQSGRSAPATDPESLLENYSFEQLDVLRMQMRKALQADGLFEDEADAMLKTWELAYFKSPGLRLFYLLPHAWTNRVLPLSCSIPADYSRTMVGRVEIVTPRQRDLIRRIGENRAPKVDWFYRTIDNRPRDQQLLRQLWEGKAAISALQGNIPAEYRNYVALGRFRNALLLDSASRNTGSGVREFTEAYEIHYYTPPDELPATRQQLKGD